MNPSTYAFENVRAMQPARVRFLAALLDPGTFALLDRLGV
jgi:hypothetical protein